MHTVQRVGPSGVHTGGNPRHLPAASTVGPENLRKVPPRRGLEAACVFRCGQQRAPGALHSFNHRVAAPGSGFRASGPQGTGHRHMHTHTPARREAIMGCQMGGLPEQPPCGGGAHRATFGWTRGVSWPSKNQAHPKRRYPELNERDFSHDGPEPGCDIKWCAFCRFHSEKSKGGGSPSVTTSEVRPSIPHRQPTG